MAPPFARAMCLRDADRWMTSGRALALARNLPSKLHITRATASDNVRGIAFMANQDMATGI
eukprot:11223793-Lingulodinium_polyedra.AAC.1